MRKQTKLVAVLSTAALLAIGASMTSFASTGWTQEDGAWVYYNKDGSKASSAWEKSGDNWYYMDSDGNMVTSQLIEDGDNYYYVDENGVMASNKWIAIDNADSGEDNEPAHYWYYFQANGKAMTNGTNTKVALKTINGKKYAFDSEGKMLYGWVDQNSAERLDNTNGDAFKQGTYYFGGEDDGAMTVGWLQTDITYDDAESDSIYKEVEPVFTDDQDQTRWFYFMGNGKKVASTDDGTKNKTINGKTYTFDKNGAMVAEWSRNVNKATNSTSGNADYTRTWRYFNSVEDGARNTRGWFKVVPAEKLDSGNYDDESDAWYYADGKGNLYAGEFKTIKGKEYAFNDKGRMVDGLKMIKRTGNKIDDIKGGDDIKAYAIDTEDGFNKHAGFYTAAGYNCYYFGNGEDGAVKTGDTKVGIDDGTYNFKFLTSGGHKGAGKTGVDSKKLYNSGKLVAANKDMKYQLVLDRTANIVDSTLDVGSAGFKGYYMYDDLQSFFNEFAPADARSLLYIQSYSTSSTWFLKDEATYNSVGGVGLFGLSYNDFKKETGLSYNDKYGEIHLFTVRTQDDDKVVYFGLPEEYKIVNTSGNVSDRNDKVKDGNGINYKLYNGKILCTYTDEN